MSASTDTNAVSASPQFRGNIPRVSRLPTTRASTNALRSLRPAASRDSLRGEGTSTLSGLRKPTSYSTPALAAAPIPLGEGGNKSTKARYGWSVPSQQPAPSKTRDVVPVTEPEHTELTLDTTPPSSTTSSAPFESANENLTNAGHDLVVDENAGVKSDSTKEKRRPRPSLSERTIETLSQISPSPSPSRRRSSFFGNDASMGPPARPASSINRSRPGTAYSSRSASPTKPHFRPAGAVSPTKSVTSLPALPSPSSVYTPPKAFIKGHQKRTSKPQVPPKISSTMATRTPHDCSTVKAKPAVPTKSPTLRAPSRSLSATVSKTLQPKPSLSSLFQDPPKPPPKSSRIDLSRIESNASHPLSPSESDMPLPGSTSNSTSSSGSQDLTISDRSSAASGEIRAPPKVGPKSSLALRAAIAKAKVESSKKVPIPHPKPSSEILPLVSSADAEDNPISHGILPGDNKLVLKKRIQSATTSGHLNIAALGLKEIPEEVAKMYDFDPSSGVSWSETVDLVKLVAADNDIAELRDGLFPDISPQDLTEDDERIIQFGGLEVLDMHSNRLQSLPLGLRRLERLHTLKLSNNLIELSNMEVICQIESLKELYLANNQLVGALPEDIDRLVNLQVLDLHSNKLDTLPATMSKLRSLRKLNVAENQITFLPFESLATLPLVEINASRNKLAGCLLPASVDNLESLEILDISFNFLDKITERETLSLPKATTITVDGNRLLEMPRMSAWSGLSTFTASENLFSDFPIGFSDLFKLKNADLSRNNIKVVDEKIRLMDELVSLNLASNPLRDRKYLTMSTNDLKDDLRKRAGPAESEGATMNTGEVLLNYADPNCGSEVILYECKNGTLDLSSKSLSSIDIATINLSSAVHTLKLSNNDFTIIPIELLTHPQVQWSLKFLDLSHNPLAGAEYISQSLFLPCLESLFVVSTGLTSFDSLTMHLKAPELRELNISCHRLSGHLPWARTFFPKVTTLLATDNWFTSVDVEALRGLEVVDVRNNEIESLPPKIGCLGSNDGKPMPGRLRCFEVAGNKFRVPRWEVVERGTEAVLKDLRRMVPLEELDDEWKD